jgi:hypothetical protein
VSDSGPDEIPIEIYLSEPLACGWRRERGPDVLVDLRPRRQCAADVVPVQTPWPWRPSRGLDQLLPEILVFLEAEIRADELADAQAAGEEKAA